MSILKCKMCGGTIEFNIGDTIGTCDSCGTKQTLPRIDGEKRANLYDRANHFRRANDYDKAANLFNQILNDDPEDSEGYWSLVLCKYGIEYVKDPKSEVRIPTVNRAQYTSIFQDENYKAAIKYADEYQREMYETEARVIDDIQKKILDISKKETPFDVFISYKESDADGRRTIESVLATDLYEQLTKEGFKVFLSRITLEDKLGTAYEPYIFAALNSSKVMVVIGTSRQNYDAVWVKNEWSRFLLLIASGEDKVLIPAYRDMDPYDLPEEFSHLQAQDMGKLGFMQDLVRGVKKIVGVDKVNNAVSKSNSSGHSAEPLITRAKMFIEDGEWKKAEDICEQALNIEPERAEIYVCIMLIDFKASSFEEIVEKRGEVEENPNYLKARKFASRELLKELDDLKIKTSYEIACNQFRNGRCSEDFLKAKILFENLIGYEDSGELLIKCEEKIDYLTKKEKKEKTNKSIILCVSSVIVIILLIIFYNTVIKENIYKTSTYKEAMEYMENGNYEKAMKSFKELGDYRDSKDKVSECDFLQFEQNFEEVKQSFDNKKYDNALSKLEKIRVSLMTSNNPETDIKKKKLFDETLKYAKSYIQNEDVYRDISYRFIKLMDDIVFSSKEGREEVLEFKYEFAKKHPIIKMDEYSPYLEINADCWSDLIYSNYKDSKKIKDELYQFEVEVFAINTDGEDTETNLKRVGKEETVYFHYRLINVPYEKNNSTKISVKGVFPNGSVTTGTSDFKVHLGDESWWNFYYNNPRNGEAGILKVTFYDEKGNEIGSSSVEMI